MADEDISLNEDQLLDDVNGEAELLNEVRKLNLLKKNSTNSFITESHTLFVQKRMKRTW